MNTIHVTLALLLVALAAPALPPAAAASCSPIPHVVDIQCLPVPSAGAVAISHVSGAGLQVRSTPGWSCGALSVTGPSTANVQCTPLVAGPCVAPMAFAMSADINHGLGVTAQCGGAVATCAAGPASHCFGNSLAADVYPITCTVDTSPAPLTAFTWWAQCSA